MTGSTSSPLLSILVRFLELTWIFRLSDDLDKLVHFADSRKKNVPFAIFTFTRLLFGLVSKSFDFGDNLVVKLKP